MISISMHTFKAGGKKQTFQALLFRKDLDAYMSIYIYHYKVKKIIIWKDIDGLLKCNYSVSETFDNSYIYLESKVLTCNMAIFH